MSSLKITRIWTKECWIKTVKQQEKKKTIQKQKNSSQFSKILALVKFFTCLFLFKMVQPYSKEDISYLKSFRVVEDSGQLHSHSLSVWSSREGLCSFRWV